MLELAPQSFANGVPLGNVVGLIKSATAPAKKYVLWAKEVPTIQNPDAVLLHYYNYGEGQWQPVSGFIPIAADPGEAWPAFTDLNTTLLFLLNAVKAQTGATTLPTPAAPRVISQNDANNTLVFEAPSGWLITDCGYSIAGAATVNATSSTIQVGDVALAPNQVRIFVRATATNNEGRAAYNSAPFTVTQAGNVTPTAPTLVAQDDTANTFTFAPPAGFSITQCVYTLNGSAPAFCQSATLQVGNVNVAVNQLQVYVPAGPERNRGDILANNSAFTIANTNITATYQSTASDYQNKCGQPAPGGYQLPIGTGQGSTQTAADAEAKADALGKITCPIAPITYNTNLSPGEDGSGVTYNGAPGTVLRFNAFTPGDPLPGAAIGFFVGGQAVGNADLGTTAAQNVACALSYNGTTYAMGNGAPLKFQNTDTVNLS